MQPTMTELLFLLFPAICFKVQDALYVFVLVGLKRKKKYFKFFLLVNYPFFLITNS